MYHPDGERFAGLPRMPCIDEKLFGYFVVAAKQPELREQDSIAVDVTSLRRKLLQSVKPNNSEYLEA
jgi:hypothetical protein